MWERTPLKSVRFKLLIAVSAFVILGGAIYVCLALTGLLPGPGSDYSETKLELKNVAGTDLEVIETSTDGIAKDQYVSVYIYESGTRSNRLARLLHPKELLFRYDPWNWDEPMPSIEAVGRSSIRISLARVSSVIYQRRAWKTIPVDYRIGFVEYR